MFFVLSLILCLNFVWGTEVYFPYCFWVNFMCAKSCSVQVTENTHISSLHMVNKAMTGHLMSLLSITMKEVKFPVHL